MADTSWMARVGVRLIEAPGPVNVPWFPVETLVAFFSTLLAGVLVGAVAWHVAGWARRREAVAGGGGRAGDAGGGGGGGRAGGPEPARADAEGIGHPAP